MEPKKWAVDVGPNERLNVTVDSENYLHITKVAMGDLMNGEDVKNLHVYYTRYDHQKVVLAILPSEGAREASTKAVLEPYETAELSHGWQEGSVHFSGHFVKVGSKDLHEYDLDVYWKEWTEKKKQQEKGGSSRMIKTEAQKTESWSIVVGPNESQKVTVGDEFVHITEAALGDLKSGKAVESFNVYLNSFGNKQVLATISSQCATEAIPLVIDPNTEIELSHDWEDGSVHISGHTVKIVRPNDDCAYLGGKQQKASLKALTEEEENRKKRSPRRAPTSQECMEIVEGFEGFEDGTKGYMQALLLFRDSETDRVHFMIPKTDATKMEYLKEVLNRPSHKNN